MHTLNDDSVAGWVTAGDVSVVSKSDVLFIIWVNVG